MSKKKVGIVSSFNVLCGNAAYSEALLKGISGLDEYEAVAIHVPVDLQKQHSSVMIKALLEQVKICDAVNIQMELGLYGPTPSTSLKLLKHIIANSKKASITMHRIDPPSLAVTRRIYNAIKAGQIKTAIRSLFQSVVRRELCHFYQCVIHYGFEKNATFIVHTYREEKRLKQICPQAQVIVHPIIWPEYLPCNPNIELESKFKHKLPIIGLFGFISLYKNFEQTVKVALLSLKCNLVLAGGMHPASPNYGIQPNQSVKYLSRISKIISKKELQTYICISPDDETLLALIKAVDVVVIPYFETGQSGSGIASLAIQYGKRVVFSDTGLVKELIPFLNQRPFLFDVALDASLIYAIKDSLTSHQPHQLAFHGYTFKSNINAYIVSLGLGENLHD